ncbi:CaiB/BaiF CoA transferase family protein [Parvibium lacunae]|uniref:CoA transferase n=1 Tax=Parvibium lacunae TaxID=1888893 RepID=A0A368L145_9BURK|nr:CoA transferase [Parvibium lacunae]RCS57157.1 CoA transferase [Parvibium lacunae]
MSPAAPPPSATPLPLAGIKVLELGQLIAGPFAGRVLADFGAEVVKVEPPQTGDPLRNWRVLRNGTSLWWQAQSRNKRSIVIDLKQPAGQQLVRDIIHEFDILIENFKPGALEAWGLGWDELVKLNPRLIMLRISGYGQTGPYSHLPGFGSIGEAMGGLRYLTGEPGRVPVRTGVSLGDTLAALHAVIGCLLALQQVKQSGAGQVVDVALYESVFNITESLLSEYDAAGVVREPAGSALPGIAPSNAYACQDGHFLIAGNGDGIFRRLMTAIGRADLAARPDLQDNAGRVAHVVEIDQAIGAWCASKTIADALAILVAANVPAGRIYTAADIANDPHYLARDMILSLPTLEGEAVAVPGIVPKLTATPGCVRHPAPRLGQDTRAILTALGIPAQRLDALLSAHVIAESLEH